MKLEADVYIFSTGSQTIRLNREILKILNICQARELRNQSGDLSPPARPLNAWNLGDMGGSGGPRRDGA